MSSSRIHAATGLAPAIWGTTYLTTTQLLPAGRPLLAAVLRALPAGLVLIAITRRLPVVCYLPRVGLWLRRALMVTGPSIL